MFLACTKRFFHLSAEATINVFNARLRVRCAILPLKKKQMRSSWSLAKGFNILKRRKNQIKMSFDMCFVQNVPMKSLFTFWTTKIQVLTRVKRTKLAVTCRILVLKTKNRQLCHLAVTVHIASLKRRVATLKKEIHLQISRILSTNNNKRHRNLCQKKQKAFLHSIIVSNLHWLMQLNKNSFPLTFFTISVYSTTTWFSQSPTKILRGLWTLEHIQFLWLSKISSMKRQ